MGPRSRRQLHQVEADDPLLRRDGLHQLADLVPAQAARLRRADGGKLARVNAVEVDRDVNEVAEGVDDRREIWQATQLARREEGQATLSDQLRFLGGGAAQPDLSKRPVVEHPAQAAGMVIARVLIFVA